MGFNLTGYLLESPRMGAANSSYTTGTNVFISNQTEWDNAYPVDESKPSTEYLVLVLHGGDLPEAVFGWTKNETVKRFDYDAAHNSFAPLRGSSPDVVGELTPDSNTDRLRVAIPVTSDTSTYPIRIYTETQAFSITLVPDDASFSVSVPVGSVELSLESGLLNWNSADLTTYEGDTVYYQGQTHRSFNETTGLLGTLQQDMAMNPIPPSGTKPLIRIGFRMYLITEEKPNEAAFTSPLPGYVQWSADTGVLHFNSSDLSTYAGDAVYMDGILYADDLQLETQQCGTIATPVPIAPIPQEGGDIIVRAVTTGQSYQFKTVLLVDDVGEASVDTVKIKKSDGSLHFHPNQVAARGSWEVYVDVCDLPIEHGLSFRFFRSLVDMQNTKGVDDVTSHYTTERAVLASPIVGAPFVTLPADPLEDRQLTVKIEQGTGTYLTNDLPNLKDPTKTGFGYVIDTTEHRLYFAEALPPTVLTRTKASSSDTIPGYNIQDFRRSIEMQNVFGDYQPLSLETDAFLDPLTGVLSYVTMYGKPLIASEGSLSGVFLTDITQTFLNDMVGHYVLFPTTSQVCLVKRVDSPVKIELDADPQITGMVRYEILDDTDVLADRTYSPITIEDPSLSVERITYLGLASNSPRLTVPLDIIQCVRFRFGERFSEAVHVVSSFSGSLPKGTVEILETTGEVNFSAEDLGEHVYQVKKLKGSEYRLTPELGFFDFEQRFLEGEQLYVSYTTSDGESYTEYVPFLIRKELTPKRTAPTTTIAFNTKGRTVVSTPEPKVYRGGRPQDATQVVVDTTLSSITFLDDEHLDGLLPHGSIVQPEENIYIDYYVNAALGGEKTASLLHFPLATVPVQISATETAFKVVGDHTADFAPQAVLRINQTEVHLIESSSYDGSETTITLFSGDFFKKDYKDPALDSTIQGLPEDYFVFIPEEYDTILKGSNTITFHGSASIVPGMLLHMGNELHSVQSVAQKDGKTHVTVTMPFLNQYQAGTILITRTRLPIFEQDAQAFQTSAQPVKKGLQGLSKAMERSMVIRKEKGRVGAILGQDEYTESPTGHIKLVEPIGPFDTIATVYTGYREVPAGRNLRVSVVSLTVPSEEIQGQILTMDYTMMSPDSFYFRVPKISEYRMEMAARYSAQSSSGPQLQNASTPLLYQQGLPSPYYNESVITNDDVVAVALVKYYNDNINHLEDALQGKDGRIVGGFDGRFLFDGNTQNPPRASWDQVTNQIDDVFKISDAPYEFHYSFPTYTVTSIGTYKTAWEPSTQSRLFPTWRRSFGVTAVGTETGDVMLSVGEKNVTNISNVRTRQSWALLTEKATAGSTQLVVDQAQGEQEGLRPPFAVGMEVVLQNRDGFYVIQDTDHVTVTAFTDTTVTLSNPLLVDAQAGATLYQSPLDTNRTTYQYGRDFGVNLEDGELTYVVPYPPYDGSDPLVPTSLQAHPLPNTSPLSLDVSFSNQEMEPRKIPALFGDVYDDDGETTLPLVGPDLLCEKVGDYGVLPVEKKANTRVQTSTSDVEHFTGSLDSTRTIVTLDSNTIAKQYDLLRILDGANGLTSYHRIASVSGNVVTVESAFAVQDAGFSCIICTSPEKGSGTASFSGIMVTDPAATFVTWGVVPGHTFIVQAGAHAGARAQVTRVVNETTLEIDLSWLTGPASYRITDCVASYSDLLDYHTALQDELDILQNRVSPIVDETTALESFLDGVLTSDVSGTGDGSGTTFTDATADFSSVKEGDILYLRSQGVFRVVDVPDATTLEIEPAFSSPFVGASYQVGILFGVSFENLQLVYADLSKVDDFATETSSFQALLQPVPVVITAGVVDPNAYATSLTMADVVDRDAQIQARMGSLGIGDLENVLKAGALYDTRYLWIDARTNRKTGLLPQKQRAEDLRIENQRKALEKMEKSLAL